MDAFSPGLEMTTAVAAAISARKPGILTMGSRQRRRRQVFATLLARSRRSSSRISIGPSHSNRQLEGDHPVESGRTALPPA